MKVVLGLMLILPGVLSAAESADTSGIRWSYSQCVDYAYQKNISLQQKMLDERTSSVDLEESRAQWQPTLDFATTQGFTNYARPSEGVTANQYSGTYGLNASWVVFNGNIRRNQIKLDELQKQIASLGIDDYRYTLQTEILTKYLNILYAKEAVTIAKDNLAVSEYQMQRARALMESGKLSRVDCSQIESQYYSDKYSLTEAEGAWTSAKTELKTLLQLDINTEFDVADIDFEDAAVVATLPLKADVFASACSWIPSLQQYRLQGDASQYSIDIARGGYYPQISLNAGVGTSNISGEGNLGTQLLDRLNESISLTVSVPILDNKKTKTAVERAKIERLNADLDLQNAVTTLSQTIETIYIEAENAQSKYESCTEKLKSAQLTDDLVNEQFQLGLINTLDLLTAHSSLLSAKQELLQSKYMALLNRRLLDFYLTQQITL